MVQPLLRKLFLLHFILDYIVAVPLMFAPQRTMLLLGWDAPESVATRLVAAALMGIGGISLIAYKADAETYRHMLTMKLLWSGTAVLGLVLSIIDGAPVFTWVFLFIFAVFFGIWLFYRMRV
jgi:hypothetical protein